MSGLQGPAIPTKRLPDKHQTPVMAATGYSHLNVSPNELSLLLQGLQHLAANEEVQALRQRLLYFGANLEWLPLAAPPCHHNTQSPPDLPLPDLPLAAPPRHHDTQSPPDLSHDLEQEEQELGPRKHVSLDLEQEEQEFGPRKHARLLPIDSNPNPRKSSCPKRNGAPLQRWQHEPEGTPARTSNVTADTMISTLAAAHLQSSYAIEDWMSSISSSIRNFHEHEFSDHSLASTVRRCQGFTQRGVGISFLSMLAYIQVSVGCQMKLLSDGGHGPRNLTQLYDTEVAPLPNPPSARSFLSWNAIGRKFAAIAAGGSIYLLMVIAGLELRWHTSELVGRVPWELGKMLRQPDTSNTPELIRTRIIPLIAQLRRALPLSLHGLFPPEFTNAQGIQASGSLDATDLFVSDVLFGTIQQYNFNFPERDPISWQLCNDPVPGEETAGEMEVFVIETTFDRSAPSNKRRSGSDDPSANIAWTDRERRKAEVGHVVEDVGELVKKLGEFYTEGCKPLDEYIRISNSILPNSALDIRNEDGTLMAFVCTGIPNHIRNCLLDNLISCFDGKDILKHRVRFTRGGVEDPGEIGRDNEVTLEREPFQCAHLSWWNRYATSGQDAPESVHPHELISGEGSRVNYTQMLPYTSVDMVKHERLYKNLLRAYEELFAWIDETFKNHLPDEYEILAELVDLLPGQAGSPVHPFLSLVVNINVCTEGHRDAHDKDFCLVLALGCFEGGELVMFEQGSSETMHFNLDFEGQRASFVLHTDKGMDQWKENRNMWKDNQYFN
ncbi:hypothetical protein K503DRAFT_806306 [Rhizopogon vinicolor AM-OR11-026]|uniref:Uncharacterized protein n=1 Tax=Rhizopogon vinicolor AM-OR11-026 TaxID=1314800 RepID=A0A1B7MF10_9AGAM|nr:hypothetical protein K503DRAFT_806306 [Rhizopogon vinicolor AM-OR11-026]